MPKTTIQVRAKKWGLFNKECKATSMRRDDFLNRALPAEIEILGAITPCDATGESWLKRNWLDESESQDIELQAVSLNLSESVLTSLNKVCKEKRIPRDAFIDCALTYLTTRLYEAAIVIKNPRTNQDLASDIASTYVTEDIDDETSDQWIVEAANKWAGKRNLAAFKDDYYKERLSFDKTRVEERNFLLALAKDMGNKPATPKDLT